MKIIVKFISFKDFLCFKCFYYSACLWIIRFLLFFHVIILFLFHFDNCFELIFKVALVIHALNSYFIQFFSICIQDVLSTYILYDELSKNFRFFIDLHEHDEFINFIFATKTNKFILSWKAIFRKRNWNFWKVLLGKSY